jgi:hypothetical protein
MIGRLANSLPMNGELDACGALAVSWFRIAGLFRGNKGEARDRGDSGNEVAAQRGERCGIESTARDSASDAPEGCWPFASIAMPGAVSFAVMTGKGKTRLTSVPANPAVKCAARQRRRAIAAETPPAARPGSAAP